MTYCASIYISCLFLTALEVQVPSLNVGFSYDVHPVNRRERSSSVLGGDGILAYLVFIDGRPDGLRGISPFMPLFSNRFNHAPTKTLEGIL